MNIIEQYLLRSQEIIGNRTQEEKRYDKEVINWLRKGKNIGKAIKKANKKFQKRLFRLMNQTLMMFPLIMNIY